MQYFPPSNPDDFTKNIQAAVAIEQCQIAFGYIAWTLNYVLGSNLSVDNYTLYSPPFVLSQNNTSYSLQDAPLCPFPTCHKGPNTPATLYAAVFASMAGTASYNFETWTNVPRATRSQTLPSFNFSCCLDFWGVGGEEHGEAVERGNEESDSTVMPDNQ
jgi:hypothetical protein